MGNPPLPPLRIIPGFLGVHWLGALLEEVDLAQREITIYGKQVLQPRLTALYGSGAYRYSGQTLVAKPFPETMQGLRERVQERLGVVYDICLVNYYRDGRDGVGWHADDEREIDQTRPIASLSFGAVRSFQVREKGGGEISASSTYRLGGGDLLVMDPGMQGGWLHSIPKTAKPVGPRLNLTFRGLVG